MKIPFKVSHYEDDAFAVPTVEIEPGKKIVKFFDEDPDVELLIVQASIAAVNAERQKPKAINIEVEILQATLNTIGDAMDDVHANIGDPPVELVDPVVITVTRDANQDVTLIELKAGAFFFFSWKPKAAA